MASNPATSLPPGFRFHPTDEELILHYLRHRSASLPCPASIIAEVDIYKFDPWDLPAKSMFGEREWYFFSPRDRKYPNGIRPNRAAASGYWKATGTDKAIVTSNGNEEIGVKKALVFYKGRPSKGVKTDWIMHEYRLAQSQKSNSHKPLNLRDTSMRLDDWVLCRIYKKCGDQSPSGDVELEEHSRADEAFDIANTSSNTPANDDTFLKLPKSCSLTELLDAVDYSVISQLLDNHSDMFLLGNRRFEYPLADQALSTYISGNNDEGVYQVHETSQTESPVMATDNALKRQRSGDGFYVGSCSDLFLHHAKKPVNARIMPNSTNDYDDTKFNFVSLPSLNQQLALNSHSGKQ